MKQPSSAAIFLDRDGTLMHEVEYCRDPAKVALLSGVQNGLAQLKSAGYQLVIITNQSGLGRGWITQEEYEAVHRRLIELLGPELIHATYYCPDHPDFPTDRRKPAPGMIHEAARDLHLDLARSYFIGDRQTDLDCARAAGVRAILVQTGYGAMETSNGALYVAPDFKSAAHFILKDAAISTSSSGQ